MILKINNYTKVIKGKTILDNINIELKSGNIYGLYGRNGSGKTMLLRAISTLIFPTHGDVLVDGKSIINEDFDLNNFGTLIESPDFYSHLSCFDNLDLLYTINNKKNNQHIDDILKQVGMFEFKKKKYKECSLGMKQRLRIAQAIMENQKIILLDEPTNALDEKSVKDIYNILISEKKQDKIILIASHNKEDLNYLCDKVYKIDAGKIIGEITGEVKL